MSAVRTSLLARVGVKPFGGRPLSGAMVADLLPKLALGLNEARRRSRAFFVHVCCYFSREEFTWT